MRSIVANAQLEKNTQVEQTVIANQYFLMKKLLSPAEMPRLNDVGFKVHSQFEEDGMLLYIFSVIGVTNKKVVEICVGDGTECMAANLIINHGWNALLFDGDQANVDSAVKFYSTNRSTFLYPPTIKRAWLTQDNVDRLITESGFVGEIDLLSLDIDGNDYYLMEAIRSIRPRVIICETHNVIPGDRSLTIPYESDFDVKKSRHPDFTGVSLLAMKKLLQKKGYRLIGAHRYGFNAIFMLNELGKEYFPEISIKSVHANAYTELRQGTAWNEVKELPWVEVG